MASLPAVFRFRALGTVYRSAEYIEKSSFIRILRSGSLRPPTTFEKFLIEPDLSSQLSVKDKLRRSRMIWNQGSQ